MKFLMPLFSIVMLALSATEASWENATDSGFISGARSKIMGKGGEESFLELRPGKPTMIEVENKGSSRWKIRTEGKGIFIVSKEGEQVQSKSLAKGENDIKFFLEEGKYQVNTTIGARAQCFIWKKRSLSSLVPDGGGFSTYLQSGEQKYAYYRVTHDTIPVLSVQGPATAYIFFRADMSGNAQWVPVDVTVKENEAVIEHKTSDLVKSLKAEPSENPNQVISEALILKISVPDGMHKYSVHVNKCTGLVKFYRNSKKKKGLTSEAAPQGESLNETDLNESSAEADGEHEYLQKDFKSELKYHLTVRTGLLYDQNAYRYSPAYRDTFKLGLKSYRYPNVEGLSDIILPMEARASVTSGKYAAAADLSLNAYKSNPKLTNMGIGFSLTWTGSVKLRATYRLTPYDPVRPTYYAPRSYELMQYSENKGTISAMWNRWKLKPGIDFSVGYYDYNATFNVYDAPFWETGLGLSHFKPLGFQFGVKVGNVAAKRHTGQDQSNLFISGDLDGHFPIRNFLIGAKGALLTRKYATKDAFDTHYHRHDLSGDEYGYVKYAWSHFSVISKYGYFWRATASPFHAIDEEKDYNGITGGIELTWEINA